MDLSQFKIVYQKVLDSGRDPKSVEMNLSDAKTICTEYDIGWEWYDDEVHHLYGMDVIVNDDMQRGSVVFGENRSGVYPGNGEPRSKV